MQSEQDNEKDLVDNKQMRQLILGPWTPPPYFRLRESLISLSKKIDECKLRKPLKKKLLLKTRLKKIEQPRLKEIENKINKKVKELREVMDGINILNNKLRLQKSHQVLQLLADKKSVYKQLEKVRQQQRTINKILDSQNKSLINSHRKQNSLGKIQLEKVQIQIKDYNNKLILLQKQSIPLHNKIVSMQIRIRQLQTIIKKNVSNNFNNQQIQVKISSLHQQKNTLSSEYQQLNHQYNNYQKKMHHILQQKQIQLQHYQFLYRKSNLQQQSISQILHSQKEIKRKRAKSKNSEKKRLNKSVVNQSIKQNNKNQQHEEHYQFEFQ